MASVALITSRKLTRGAFRPGINYLYRQLYAVSLSIFNYFFGPQPSLWLKNFTWLLCNVLFVLFSRNCLKFKSKIVVVGLVKVKSCKEKNTLMWQWVRRMCVLIFVRFRLIVVWPRIWCNHKQNMDHHLI